jgi:DNA-binding NarL/FixJ family response regulator
VNAGQTWATSEQVLYLIEALSTQPAAPEAVLPSARMLSPREEEIARLAAHGLSNRQISERLDLSEHTVKNYMFRVFEKLGVSTRVELTLYALKLSTPQRPKVRFALPPLREKWYGTS